MMARVCGMMTSTTWLLIVLTSGTASRVEKLPSTPRPDADSKKLIQPRPSLLSDVGVDTSSRSIPDDIPESSISHLVKLTTSASPDDVSDSKASDPSDAFTSVLVSGSGEPSAPPPLIPSLRASDRRDKSPSSGIDHHHNLQSSPPGGKTSSLTPGNSTAKTVSSLSSLQPPKVPSSAATSNKTTLEPDPFPITCPSGSILDGSDCIPERSNFTAIITGTSSQKPPAEDIPEVETNSDMDDVHAYFHNKVKYAIIVCSLISVLALTLRIILQFLTTGVRARPNRLQLHLSIAMLVEFVLVLFVQLLTDVPKACTVLPFSLLYFYTAAMSWMTVIAVDTWTVFRPSAAFSRSDEEGISLLVHYLSGWERQF